MPTRVKNGVRPISFELSVERFARHSSRKELRGKPARMVGCGLGCVPEHHHGVANKLVDCSAFGEERSVSTVKYRDIWLHEHVGVG